MKLKKTTKKALDKVAKEKGGKIKTGKHTNIIEMKFDYENGNPIPVGIRMHNDCTLADKLLGLIHLMEVLCEESKDEGKTVIDFVANCMAAYADTFNDDDD